MTYRTPTQLEVKADTLQDEMHAWGTRFRATQKSVADRAREAWQLYLRWVAAGNNGDFSTALSEASGLPRTTAWRAWRTGKALAGGADPTADQIDLIDAARALDNGASVTEVNRAIQSDSVRDLANTVDVGFVGRRMSPDAAELRSQVQRRLGLFGLDHLPPEERDEVVYSVFLELPDDNVRRIVASWRRGTENHEGTGKKNMQEVRS